MNVREIRVPLLPATRNEYEAADAKRKFRIAGENPLKLKVIQELLVRHAGEQTLVIGQYLEQLKMISEHLDAPMISGITAHEERERLY